MRGTQKKKKRSWSRRKKKIINILRNLECMYFILEEITGRYKNSENNKVIRSKNTFSRGKKNLTEVWKVNEDSSKKI